MHCMAVYTHCASCLHTAMVPVFQCVHASADHCSCGCMLICSRQQSQVYIADSSGEIDLSSRFMIMKSSSIYIATCPKELTNCKSKCMTSYIALVIVHVHSLQYVSLLFVHLHLTSVASIWYILAMVNCNVAAPCVLVVEFEGCIYTLEY